MTTTSLFSPETLAPTVHQTEPLSPVALPQTKAQTDQEDQGHQITTFRLDLVAAQEGSISFDVVQARISVEYLGTGKYADPDFVPWTLAQHTEVITHQQTVGVGGIPSYHFTGRIRMGALHDALMNDLFQAYHVARYGVACISSDMTATESASDEKS